jgi:hypothetical protein
MKRTGRIPRIGIPSRLASLGWPHSDGGPSKFKISRKVGLRFDDARLAGLSISLAISEGANQPAVSKEIGIDPQANIRDALEQVSTHSASQIEELLPDRWKDLRRPGDAAEA